MSVPSSENNLTLSIERTLDAPRAAVWRCWTEADLLKQWYCPAPWTVPEADIDLRPGGRMNVLMKGPDEGSEIAIAGCLLEVVDGERLVFTDAYTEGFVPAPTSFMTGVVELSDAGANTTRMVWSARHATELSRKQHLEMGFESGWNTAATQLETLARQVATDVSDETMTTAPSPGALDYVDGFLASVPDANRNAYVEHAVKAARFFKTFGALQIVECWGDDIPDGELTSMPMAVDCKPDESVVFSWIRWPSRAVRDAAWERIMSDPYMESELTPMPFDGKRMIHGGFEMIVSD